MLINVWLTELSEEEQKAFRKELKLPVTKDLLYYSGKDCYKVLDLCVEKDSGEYSSILIKVKHDKRLGGTTSYRYMSDDNEYMIIRIMDAYLVEMQQANFLSKKNA